MRRWKRLLPLVASAALLAWLVWRVSPQALVRALTELDWRSLLPLTAGLVLSTYLWDTVGLWYLFADPGRPLSYGAVLRARGAAYLFSAFHFGLGQGYLAWTMARLQQRPVLWAIAQCMLLVYVDLYVLLGLGLCGASLSVHPRSRGIATFCAGGLLALVAGTWLVRRLPRALVERVRRSRWGDWLASYTWSWGLFLRLCFFRLTYIALGMTYAVVGLWLCGVRVDRLLVLGAVPIMALVDGLPISVSGLGTRETTLLLLLDPEQPARLVAFCLTWSGGVIIGRGVIGLAHWWFPQRLGPP